jgi:hypothetical protein
MRDYREAFSGPSRRALLGFERLLKADTNAKKKQTPKVIAHERGHDVEQDVIRENEVARYQPRRRVTSLGKLRKIEAPWPFATGTQPDAGRDRIRHQEVCGTTLSSAVFATVWEKEDGNRHLQLMGKQFELGVCRESRRCLPYLDAAEFLGRLRDDRTSPRSCPCNRSLLMGIFSLAMKGSAHGITG